MNDVDPDVPGAVSPARAAPLSDEQVEGVVGGVRRNIPVFDVVGLPGGSGATSIPYPGSPLAGGSGSGSGQPTSNGDGAGTLKGTASSGPKGS